MEPGHRASDFPADSSSELLRHSGALRALAHGVLGDEHAAEDVLQETFVRALVAPPPHRERLGGWLSRVARGLALRRRRSEARRSSRERRYAQQRPEASDPGALSREEALRGVVEAVLALAEPYRRTILLRYFEGLAPSEIAKRTETPVATVYSRLQRAHALLRERLDREFGPRRGGAHGAMASLLGMRAPAGSAALGGGAAWKVAAGLAACAAILGLLPLLDRSEPVDPAAPVVLAGASSATVADGPVAPRESARREPLAEQAESAAVGSTQPSELAPGVEPGPYELEIEVVAVDRLGRPVSSVSVLLAPDGHALNDVGSTAWNGRLNLRWRGFEPVLDVVLCAGRHGYGATLLRRVRLVAGVPHRIVLGLEPWSGSDRRDIARAPARSGGSASSARIEEARVSAVDEPETDPKSFALDSAGNGVFTDPWLAALARPLTHNLDGWRLADDPPCELGSYYAVEEVGNMSFEQVQVELASICGTILGEDGQPIAGAEVAAVAQRHAWGTWTSANEQGEFSLAVPPGSVELWAGGGVLGVDHVELELAAGQEFIWRAQLRRGEVVRARLVDRAGRPLAGWEVEARGGGSHVGRGVTDPEGRVVIAGLAASAVSLLARPADRPWCPKLLAADALWPSEAEQTIALRGDLAPASVRIELACQDGEPLAQGEARLWRLDSGEGVRLSRVPSDADDATGLRLEAGGLLPGLYALEVGAPGCGGMRAGEVSLPAGATLDFGRVELPSARLVLRALGGDDPARGSCAGLVLWADAGARISSSTISLILTARELRVAPGAYELAMEIAPRDGEASQRWRRPLALALGQRLEIDPFEPAPAER